MLTQTETARLAGMANALRPDWPIPSLRTFITTHLTSRAYADVAVALAYVACDPVTDTPKRLLEAGPWWRVTSLAGETMTRPITRCAHGNDAARCETCRPPALDPEVTRAGVAAARAALRSAPGYHPPPERPKPPAPDPTNARNRIDKEIRNG